MVEPMLSFSKMMQFSTEQAKKLLFDLIYMQIGFGKRQIQKYYPLIAFQSETK
jgi:hypothetical protein